MEEGTKTAVLLACILIVLGIGVNIASLGLLNSAERRLEDVNNPDDYREQQHWLNHTKRISRIFTLISDAAIIVGFLSIIIIFSYDIHEKIISLEKRISCFIDQKNSENQSAEYMSNHKKQTEK